MRVVELKMVAQEKAQAPLEREARLTLTERDFRGFACSVGAAFSPNAALKQALTQGHRKIRRN